MDVYVKPLEVRWADLDPNFHVRHSVYYDWGAYCRILFFTEQGLTAAVLQEQHFGPIIFREECVFRKEIHFGDILSIDMYLVKARENYSRWSIQHTIYKNSTVVVAIITIDGAWIDTQLRKVASPPEIAAKVFAVIPRSQSFEWINK